MFETQLLTKSVSPVSLELIEPFIGSRMHVFHNFTTTECLHYIFWYGNLLINYALSLQALDIRIYV